MMERNEEGSDQARHINNVLPASLSITSATYAQGKMAV